MLARRIPSVLPEMTRDEALETTKVYSACGLADGLVDERPFRAPYHTISSAALHAVYDDPSIDEITAADLCGEYPAVRYVPPGDGPPMDILTRLGERFRFADLERERYDVDGQPVSVATPATLYQMKRSTVRPLDHADAARLAEAFGLGEEPR